MVMYVNEFETKENKIWTKDKIEPQHIRCIFFSHNRESSAPDSAPYLKLLEILNINSIFKLKTELLASPQNLTKWN